jgi:hypothetical protein
VLRQLQPVHALMLQDEIMSLSTLDGFYDKDDWGHLLDSIVKSVICEQSCMLYLVCICCPYPDHARTCCCVLLYARRRYGFDIRREGSHLHSAYFVCNVKLRRSSYKLLSLALKAREDELTKVTRMKLSKYKQPGWSLKKAAQCGFQVALIRQNEESKWTMNLASTSLTHGHPVSCLDYMAIDSEADLSQLNDLMNQSGDRLTNSQRLVFSNLVGRVSRFLKATLERTSNSS